MFALEPSDARCETSLVWLEIRNELGIGLGGSSGRDVDGGIGLANECKFADDRCLRALDVLADCEVVAFEERETWR
jgi:hypothetical protein